MTRKLTNQQKAFVERVSEILWTDWDPIRINEFGPRDEYESYVLGVVGLALNGHDADAIAERLDRIERVNMGLDGPGGVRSHLRVIAEKILAAQKELAPNESW
jgi:hypothetical protein